jgi:NAD(P)-dependent dehydrogenase (short-subunit alcohol dehydrogenase family)
MIKQRYGKIVNMSSVTGPMVVDIGETAYATTKAAVLGFTKALAYEAAPYNININAICPGYILTPMAEQIAKESNDEIGDLVSFLSSDEASYLVGTQIVIDGGSTLPETFGAVGV